MKTHETNTALNGFRAVRICIENDLIFESFSLLKNVIISYIISTENKIENSLSVRNNLSDYMQNPCDYLLGRESDGFRQIFVVELLTDVYSILANDSILVSANEKELQAILKGVFNDTIDIINQYEKLELLKPIEINDDTSLKPYWKLKSWVYKVKLNKFDEQYKCSYDKHADFVYSKENHTWQEEKELHKWDEVKTLFEYYSIQNILTFRSH